MYKGTIFITGVHGVGKSTLCRKAEQQFPIKHLTASHIIRTYKNIPVEVATKYASDIENNQGILVYGLENEMNNYSKILLDGHFVLLNDEGIFSKIDISIFEKLFIGLIVVVIDNPDEISKRLFLRDNIHYGVDMLSKMQDAELSEAHRVASTLNIHLHILDLRTHMEPASIFSSLLSTYI